MTLILKILFKNFLFLWTTFFLFLLGYAFFDNSDMSEIWLFCLGLGAVCALFLIFFDVVNFFYLKYRKKLSNEKIAKNISGNFLDDASAEGGFAVAVFIVLGIKKVFSLAGKLFSTTKK